MAWLYIYLAVLLQVLSLHPYCCRKGDPFQGPKLGSCLILGNELSKETHVLTKQDVLLGKGTQEESRRVREPRRVSGFMVMGLVSGLSSANHSDWVLPGGAHLVQPRWMLARGILGSGWTRSVSFRPFPNTSGWWWLISSVFLTRTSCHKTTHASGYYGAWPGWAVSVCVLPLTIGPWGEAGVQNHLRLRTTGLREVP